MARTFSDVHFEVEHVPETHRTLENDHTVTSEELPGMVNVYLVIDGGRILHDQYKAGRIFDAIDQAKAKQDEATAQDAANAQEPTQQQEPAAPQEPTTQQA